MYQLTPDPDVVIQIEGGVSIPNGHPWWTQYQNWLADGGEPKPVPVIAPLVPAQVTRYQARAALYKAGLLDDVEGFMALPDTDRLLTLAWQDAQTFRRHSPMVLDLGVVLSLSAAQIDELFIAAAAIE